VLSHEGKEHNIFKFGKIFISNAAFNTIEEAIKHILQKFHEEFPELTGMDTEKLYSALNSGFRPTQGADKISAADFKDLTDLLAEKKTITHVSIQGKNYYQLSGQFRLVDDKFSALAEQVRKTLAAAGFSLLTQGELEEKLGASHSDIKRAVTYLGEQENLKIIKDGFLFPREICDLLLGKIASMTTDITVASLRDSIGVSRKYTRPMLEFLDSQGITRRIGDKRVLLN
jgi:selenocysteine-specific elongation factor